MVTSRIEPLAWTLAGGVLLNASPASAHPVEDVRASTSIYFAHGWGDQDGNYGVTHDYTLTKSPGSLDITLDFDALGTGIDATIPLTGTRHGDEIWWDFDEDISVDLDDLNWTRRIEGHLVARADYVGLFANPICDGVPCPYSVTIDSVSGWVRLHGTTWPFIEWSRDADVGFGMYAGWPRPPLDSLSLGTPTNVCVSDRDRVYAGRVTLDDYVTGNGIDVRVTSANPTIVASQLVRVRPGSRRGTFLVHVPAGYEGSVDITAFSGGTSLAQTLTVGGSIACYPEFTIYELDDIELELACRGCIENLQQGEGAWALAETADGAYLRDNKGTVWNLDEWVGTAVTDTRLGDKGDLVGMLAQSESVAYFLSASDDVYVDLPGFDPAGFGPRGVAFGRSGNEPAYASPDLFSELDVGLDGATLLGGSMNGFAFGEDAQGNAFAVDPFGETWQLPQLGEQTRVVASNAVGDMAGTATEQSSMAFVLPAGQQEPWFVETSHGGGAETAGLTDAGTVVVNLRGEEGLAVGAGLYTPESGLVPLSELLTELGLPVTVSEVLHVNMAGDLAVRGTIDGQAATFGLRVKNVTGEEQ